MNVDDRSLTAINRTRERQDLVLEGKAYAADMECVWTIETGIRMEPGTAREIGQVEIPARYRDQICFVSLQLLDKDRNSVSDNFYWIANHSDFTALADLDRVTLKATARQVRTDREEPTIHVQLENASDTLAFFVHLSICETSLGQEILPSFWQDNYINLLPGQTRDVSVTMPRQPRDKTLYLKVEGNNLISQAIKIP
jgi:hypothetical protein